MMYRLLFIPLLLMPLSAGAATYPATATTAPTNTYTAASEITVAQPLPADLVTAAGTVIVSAPVGGDILAAAGTLTVEQGAGGDVRVAGGKVTVAGPVIGDVAAAGGTVHITSKARNIYAAGASVDVDGSSSGDVTLYGANVSLAGDYVGNVSVVASNRFTLGEDTHIHGILKYSAPETLTIPASSQVDGGTKYTGAYAYVPTNRQAQQYAILGMGVFFAVRILAGIIVAGLIVGLFPVFAETVSEMVLTREPYALLKLLGIGVALTVLAPVLTLLLLVSLVGAELALMLIVAYVLLGLIAYAFCGIVLGLLLRKTLLYRIRGVHDFTWKDAALGTICMHLIGLLPLLGTPLIFILALLCAGALALFAYHRSFNHHFV